MRKVSIKPFQQVLKLDLDMPLPKSYLEKLQNQVNENNVSDNYSHAIKY